MINPTNTKKMLLIAEDMFKDSNVVSLGIRHCYSKYDRQPNSSGSDVTVLLGGSVEFNSFLHRRDMVDVMLHYDLYVKKIKRGVNRGMYQSGVHDEHEFVICETPFAAISLAAYELVREK